MKTRKEKFLLALKDKGISFGKSENKVARVLITEKCNRNCSYCVNNYDAIQKQMKPLDNIEELYEYDEVCITGGEPTLVIDDVLAFIARIRDKVKTIYLYTAQWNPRLAEVVKLVDGIHYTLHENAVAYDINGFLNFQDMVAKYPEKSFRLGISPDVEIPVSIFPNRWKRVEVRTWLSESDDCICVGETLFRMTESCLL